ncbi:MAG: hypothetical protein ACRD3I_12900, partial [Terriglobales bacterium]
LLQPVPPAAVFMLLQGGWPANLVMSTVVGSVNGLRNANGGLPADAGFRELVDALTRVQRISGLAIRVEPRKDGSAVILSMRNPATTPELEADSRRVRALLGLEEGANEFEVAYGLVPRDRREVAMLTRSMLEILLQLGVGVELSDAAQRRALPFLRTGEEAVATGLVRIHSGPEMPADAYAAVSYKGHWYWIDDTDVGSKRNFTFLLILFSLAETGQSSATPLVTVPSR